MRRSRDIAIARLRMLGQQAREQASSSPGRPREDGALLDDDASGGDNGDGGATSGPPVWPSGWLWVRVVGVIVVLAVVGGGGMLAMSWPRQTANVVGVVGSSEPPTPAVSTPDPVLREATRAAELLLVHVTGEVRRPGVVRLPVGSRVQDAVVAAGGLRRGADVGATNLARLLIDGERVEVGGQGVPVSPTAPGEPGSAPVNLNLATEAQLEELPGIGPVTAAKIVAWRVANGRFSVVDELLEVSGIGPATLAELRSLVVL